MAHKLPIQFENALYHIINRGNYRGAFHAIEGSGTVTFHHGYRSISTLQRQPSLPILPAPFSILLP